MGVRRHKAGKRTKKGSIKRRFADLSRETWEVIRMIRGGAAVWIFSVDGAAHDLFFFLFFFLFVVFMLPAVHSVRAPATAIFILVRVVTIFLILFCQALG
jgi:hypothetical protein